MRFPDDEDAMGSPVHREDKANDSSIPALPEPDGNFLVKVGGVWNTNARIACAKFSRQTFVEHFRLKCYE